MGIFDYFNPVDFAGFAEEGVKFGEYAIGNTIAKATGKLTASNIPELNIAIVGTPFDNGRQTRDCTASLNKIRRHLYSLAALDKNIKIADFGNLKQATSKRGTLLALRDIIDYFNESEVMTVVIGGSQDLTAGICEAFENSDYFTLSVIDSLFDVKKGVEKFNSSNFLTRIFKIMPELFQFNLVGYQNHLAGDKLIRKTGISGEYLRLGNLRDDFLNAEPLIRNSDVVSLDISAVKHSNAPGARLKNPNGLEGEEVCRLARFAGMSDRLKVFCLFEVYPDDNDITVNLASEVIWYLFDGFIYRPDDGKMVVYKVEIRGFDKPLVFLHETDTDRWWFEISSVPGEKIIMACSEKDYHQAANNEIPERWLKFVQKMDCLSK